MALAGAEIGDGFESPRHHRLLDIELLERTLAELQRQYCSADPFPHLVLDGFLDPSAAVRAAREFPALDDKGWTNYIHVNERKRAHSDLHSWGPTLQSIAADLLSPQFSAFLERLTGESGLFGDPSMYGGGLHQSSNGGYLNIHTDFTVHPQHRTWRRRVNVLLFFNEQWSPAYGGALEFWDAEVRQCVRRIAPLENRAVIFDSHARAFHGHPDPLRCPPSIARRSLAVYYYIEEHAPVARSTNYRARPHDGARRVLIYLDKQLLRTYDRVRRRFRMSDRRAGAFLGALHRLGRRSRRD